MPEPAQVHHAHSTELVDIHPTHQASPQLVRYEDEESRHSDSSLLDDEMDFEDSRDEKRSPWARVVSYIRPSHSPSQHQRLESEGTGCPQCERRMVCWRRASRRCLKLGIALVFLLGIFQFIALLAQIPTSMFPDRIHRILKHWGQPGKTGAGLAHYPTDFTRGILPIPCHSHNDYWRMVPLFDAIEAGCVGVEADIWWFNNDNELYVGHSQGSLTKNRTLRSLYIDPLVDILEGQNPITPFFNGTDTRNGVFDTVPEQTLILLIDFKTDGETLWPHVVSALQPLRDRNYLSYSNGSQVIHGPVTVVGTGNTAFHLVDSDTSNPHHDIFFDAPLNEMFEPPPSSSSPEPPLNTTYTSLNSFYASVALNPALGPVQGGHLTEQQLDTLRGQLSGAHRRGLKARYWDLPYWPLGLRNAVWSVLVEEGVDLLNVDDLKGATQRDWGKHTGWWQPELNQ